MGRRRLELRLGEETNAERRVPHAWIAEAIRKGTPVETAPPSQPAFFWSYKDATSSGAETIVSVHVSGELSRTCEIARAASQEIDIPVHVVDSRLCELNLGFSVLAAAEAAASGATVQGVLNVLDQHLGSTTQLLLWTRLST